MSGNLNRSASALARRAARLPVDEKQFLDPIGS
jgi:hypothetical protein